MKQEPCNLTDLSKGTITTCITHAGNPTTIDYLSFTIPENIDLEAFLECSLDLSYQELIKADSGRNGYLERYHSDNVTVLTRGGAQGMGHNITLSGKACIDRQEDLKSLVSDVFACKGRFTRCDLAIDDFDGVLSIGTIQRSIADGLVVSRLGKLREFNDRDKNGNFTGRAAYFGSRKSGTFIRIYDKALQQREARHWVRVELELKKAAANYALSQVLEGDLGKVTKGILRDRLSFRLKGEQKARSRWPVAPWWDVFLGGVERLKLGANRTDDTEAQQKRIEWFVSQSKTFAEVVDLYGPTIIPAMYHHGKTMQAPLPLH